MSSKKKKDSIETFWSLIQRNKYSAALRIFRSESNNIFHDLDLLCKFVLLLKDDSNSVYQEYFTLFLVNNGLKDFMADSRNSRRWKNDKYDKNVMIMYDLLGYLLNNSQNIENKTKIFIVLINTLDIHNILGYPYFHRHLSLFWDYFMIKTKRDKTIHIGRLSDLIHCDFDCAVESIYCAMHEPKNDDMDSCHRYRGFILQILCTLYYFYSDDVKYHHKLDNKQKIMDYILRDYFLLNLNHCNNHYLYSTEKAIATFIAHSYNFGYFMNKIADLLYLEINGKRSVINVENMYRILIPFEIILQKGSYSKHKMEYYINILLTNLQTIWRVNDDNQIVHNRFLYLSNHGNIDIKLGRYTCCNGENYGRFEIISCHLINILLQNYIISFYQFNQKYLLQRTNNNEITNLLLSILNILQEEQNKFSDDMPVISATINIQNVIQKLCTKHHNKGIDMKEMDELKEEMIKLNMSFIGQIPINVLNDIINYYQRTFLLSNSDRYPLDVHRIILAYCLKFKCDPIIDTIKCGQMILIDIASSKSSKSSKTPQLIFDAEYLFDIQWMLCKVEDIIYGPMRNITRIYVKYKIGLNNYGYLWIAIQYIQWMEQYQCWKYNIILNKKQNKSLQSMLETDLKMSVFQSWWDTFVKKWMKEEKAYKKEQEIKLNQLKQQQIRTQSPIKTQYLTINAKRIYKSQRK